MGRVCNHLMVLGLALVALLFSAGCTWDLWATAVGYDPDYEAPTVYYQIKCKPQSKTLQLYKTQFGGSSSSITLIDAPVGSPINGKSCSVSTELQGRPFTQS